MGVAAVIINHTSGVSAALALAYDYGPGNAMEHENPRRVAGNVGGKDWRDRSRAMQRKLRLDGDTAKGATGRVIRLAVAVAPEDRIMSDRDWGDIARRVVNEYTGDLDRFAYEAVRHDPRHIHITLLKRSHDGRLVDEHNNYDRVSEIAARLERDYQLREVDHTRTDTPERKKRRTAGRQRAKESHREKTQDKRRSIAESHRNALAHSEAGLGRAHAAAAKSRPPVSAGGAVREPVRAADTAAAVRGGPDTRPHRGWDTAAQATAFGPKPTDFDGWAAERKRQFVRERMAEHHERQRQAEQTRGRDRGHER